MTHLRKLEIEAKSAGTKVKVFICYAREDENSARRLFKDLREEGLDPWFDMESLLPGEEWQTAIRNAIKESRYFLVLLSTNSVKKRGFLQKEIREALDISDEFPEGYTFLIPVRLEDCRPPYQKLREFQWVDMFPTWDVGLSKLLTAFAANKEVFPRRPTLKRSDLEDLHEEVLQYPREKEDRRPFTVAHLSILKMDSGKIEVSIEPVGETVQPLKSTVLMNTKDELEHVSYKINHLTGNVNWLANYLGHLRSENLDAFISILEKEGKSLLRFTFPQELIEGLKISHIVLETNMNDLPFELMYSDMFFALKYAIGRRLRIEGSLPPRISRERRRIHALLIADPQSGFQGATDECDYLAAKLAKLMEIRYIKHKDATCEETLHCFGEDYDLIHYAGPVDEDGLLLSDRLLDLSEIETHLRGSPFVFINAPSVRSPSMKLVEAFLRGGAIGYIGSLWDIHDVAAARFAMDFYTCCFQHTVGEALRMAKERAFYEKNLTWICYMLFGDPALRLF